MFADYFVLGIPLYPLRAGVPAGHDPVRVQSDQGIIGDRLGEEAELPLTFAQRLCRQFLGRDMTADHIDQPVLRRHCPVDPSPRSVLVAKAVLHADGRNTLGEPLAAGHRMGRIVGVPQLADMQPFDLVLAPAEERCPGGIDAGEIAFEVGDAEQVFRDLPDAIALADALRDFGFEPVVEETQRLLFADALGRFDAGRQNAADAVRRRFIRDRAVADGKPGVLDNRALAADGPRVIFGEKGFALAAQNASFRGPSSG